MRNRPQQRENKMPASSDDDFLKRHAYATAAWQWKNKGYCGYWLDFALLAGECLMPFSASIFGALLSNSQVASFSTSALGFKNVIEWKKSAVWEHVCHEGFQRKKQPVVVLDMSQGDSTCKYVSANSGCRCAAVHHNAKKLFDTCFFWLHQGAP